MLKKGKHIIKEINGKMCTVVESELTAERMEFLKQVLVFNKFEVEVEETVTDAGSNYTIGVTDLIFNPMINLYELNMKKLDGTPLTINYWNQLPEVDGLPYFGYREKNADAQMEDNFLANPWAFRTIG